MEEPEDQGPTAAPAETSLKQQEDPVQTNKNGTEGKSASVDIIELADVSSDRRLAQDAADETEERVSKLECLTCGMLRRRRVRRRKTPRLEFAEDPPQQEEAAIGAPTAGNTDGELSSLDDEGAGAAQSSNIQVCATDLTVNQEISDGANTRGAANAVKAATEEQETDTEQKSGEAAETSWEQEKDTDNQD